MTDIKPNMIDGEGKCDKTCPRYQTCWSANRTCVPWYRQEIARLKEKIKPELQEALDLLEYAEKADGEIITRLNRKITRLVDNLCAWRDVAQGRAGKG